MSECMASSKMKKKQNNRRPPSGGVPGTFPRLVHGNEVEMRTETDADTESCHSHVSSVNTLHRQNQDTVPASPLPLQQQVLDGFSTPPRNFTLEQPSAPQSDVSTSSQGSLTPSSPQVVRVNVFSKLHDLPTNGPSREFSLDTGSLIGTDPRKKVWDEMLPNMPPMKRRKLDDPLDYDAYRIRIQANLDRIWRDKCERMQGPLHTLSSLADSLESIGNDSRQATETLTQLSLCLVNPEVLSRGATASETCKFLYTLLRLREKFFYETSPHYLTDEIIDDFIPNWVIPHLQKTSEPNETEDGPSQASKAELSVPKIVCWLFRAGIEYSVAVPLIAKHTWTENSLKNAIDNFVEIANNHKYPRLFETEHIEDALKSGELQEEYMHSNEIAEIRCTFGPGLFKDRPKYELDMAVGRVSKLRKRRNYTDMLWHNRRRGLLLAFLRHVHKLEFFAVCIQSKLSSFASATASMPTEPNRPLPIQVLLAYAPVYALIEQTRSRTLAKPSDVEISLHSLDNRIFAPLVKAVKATKASKTSLMLEPYYRALNVFFTQGLFCAQADVSPDTAEIRRKVAHHLINCVPVRHFNFTNAIDPALEEMKLCVPAVLEAGLVHRCILGPRIMNLLSSSLNPKSKLFVSTFIILAYCPISREAFCALLSELPFRKRENLVDALSLTWQVPFPETKSVLGLSPLTLKLTGSEGSLAEATKGKIVEEYPLYLVSAQLILARFFGIPFTHTFIHKLTNENWLWSEAVDFARFHIHHWRASHVEKALLEAAIDRVPNGALPDIELLDESAAEPTIKPATELPIKPTAESSIEPTEEHCCLASLYDNFDTLQICSCAPKSFSEGSLSDCMDACTSSPSSQTRDSSSNQSRAASQSSSPNSLVSSPTFSALPPFIRIPKKAMA